jgi:hypothetical protein
MTRVFWIAGLSIAFCVFAGFTALSVVAWITHKHLNQAGGTMLIVNGVAAVFILQELRSRVRGR